jgi:hypothetical protein
VRLRNIEEEKVVGGSKKGRERERKRAFYNCPTTMET